jgi:hypothetical protein
MREVAIPPEPICIPSSNTVHAVILFLKDFSMAAHESELEESPGLEQAKQAIRAAERNQALTLILERLDLTKLPESFVRLTQLRELYLSGNQLTVEITGADQDPAAQELRDQITTQQGPIQIDAETERGDPLTTAATVVSIVLAGIQAADIIWKWWQNRQKSGANVTIRTTSRRVIDLSKVDQQHIELVLEEEDCMPGQRL